MRSTSAGLPHWEKRNNITTCIFKDNCAKKSIDIRFYGQLLMQNPGFQYAFSEYRKEVYTKRACYFHRLNNHKSYTPLCVKKAHQSTGKRTALPVSCFVSLLPLLAGAMRDRLLHRLALADFDYLARRQAIGLSGRTRRLNPFVPLRKSHIYSVLFDGPQHRALFPQG